MKWTIKCKMVAAVSIHYTWMTLKYWCLEWCHTSGLQKSHNWSVEFMISESNWIKNVNDIIIIIALRFPYILFHWLLPQCQHCSLSLYLLYVANSLCSLCLKIVIFTPFWLVYSTFSICSTSQVPLSCHRLSSSSHLSVRLKSQWSNCTFTQWL